MGEVASEGCSPPLWAGAGSPVAGAVRQARVEGKRTSRPPKRTVAAVKKNYLEA